MQSWANFWTFYDIAGITEVSAESARSCGKNVLNRKASYRRRFHKQAAPSNDSVSVIEALEVLRKSKRLLVLPDLQVAV